ncbi:MarR family winged helix-turn-helix transcriptional regulator [Candidatus Palibaumannia cicadellinicola]|uniref:Transcriptional regulator, MarR family n=1 Tax=Baumannia cicadellinicola subsp. Homalodisca coagulata TaxID=374463 RepID=Q1LTY4_BAUCH|nr:MarR family transcriptional regulator [Candidatus Baumannia cicadellinicola]ABF14140.1 transcriptional regulator, MarR family [Baumannia cicadellinicola str. Hc (Homalodisca coagulata)]MBS0032636.1 winged helix DNA-binding protein [Candidatus Baumannia cicadellinicola]MCJ7462436.1 winged helix DNA-binding protein [Candidatus Baumannia cicadellinicola]MCJ7463032.1 winged helix DNA-binding protein [Candidatus Baumannia cicadellinicola]
MEKSTDILVTVESLSRIYHRLRKEVNGQLVNEGLSMSKMKILHLITTGKTSATDIKNYMGFSSRTVVTVLDALEKEDMLQRQQSPTDRRVKYVYITEKGREKLRIAEQTHKVILDHMFAPLSKMQLDKFHEVCNLLETQPK